MQVQEEGANVKHSDRPRGCEVPSEYTKTLGSPLSVPLRVLPQVMCFPWIIPNFLHPILIYIQQDAMLHRWF